MLRAPNAGACLRCQAKFRRNSKWWESIREKEGKRAPAECLCLHFVLVTGTRRDNPLLSAMSRVGSRQRCWDWTSWTCCGVFMSPKQVSFFLFRKCCCFITNLTSMLPYEASVPRCTKNMPTFNRHVSFGRSTKSERIFRNDAVWNFCIKIKLQINS